MSKRKKIDKAYWSDYLGEVAREKRGWLVAVEVVGRNEVLTKREIDLPAMGSPLLALEYEPAMKGNAIIFSVGEETVDYEHAVDAPVELAENLDADGRLSSLEILDQNGVCTRLNFFD
jgi:hypothetical protein